MMSNKWTQYSLGQIVDFWDGRRKPLKETERSKRPGPFPYFGSTGIIDYIDDYLFDEEIILLGEDGANILSRQLPMAIRVTEKCWVNNHAHVLKPKDKINGVYLTYLLESINYIPYNTGSAQPKINKQICEKIQVILPPLPEQKKIVQVLSAWDQAIKNMDKLISAKEKQFKWLLKKLITDQKNNPQWKKVKLGEVCTTVKPPEKIQTKYFNSNGLYPIIDQSQNKIAGWTNNKKAVLNINQPVIVFGDHTCSIKYINQSFAQGADGIKILKTNIDILPKFLYFFLRYKPVQPDGYKRHFLKLKRLTVPLPSLSEQKKIVKMLSKQEEEVKMLKQLSEKYHIQKQGLMQKLLTGKWRIKV